MTCHASQTHSALAYSAEVSCGRALAIDAGRRNSSTEQSVTVLIKRDTPAGGRDTGCRS